MSWSLRKWGMTLLWLLPGLIAAGCVLAADQGRLQHVPVPGGLEGKSCFECHVKGRGVILPSQERPPRYSMAWAYRTYLQSVHGKMRMLGDKRQPFCEDCHLTAEWSKILPKDKPDSPVNPANVGRICAKCHGEGISSAMVAQGSMHVDVTRRPLIGAPVDSRLAFLPGVTKVEKSYYFGPIDVLALIYIAYILIIVGTMGVMGIYVVLDLIRQLKEKRAEKEGPHV